MKAIEQYFHVILLIMLYKIVETFNSRDETLVQSVMYDHSNETAFDAVQGGSNF